MAVKSSFILQFMETFAWDSHWFFLKYLVAFTSEVNWSQCLPHGNFQWFSSCVFQRTWHWHIYVCTWMCSLQFGSVAQSCLTMRPHGLQHARLPCPSPAPRVYPTHVHWVGDAIQPSHLLSSPSPPAFNLSQHQGPFKWVSSLHQVAKVLEFQLQHQSSQWLFRTDFLWDGLVGSPCSPRNLQESSPTPQFKSINSSVLSFPYSPTLTSMHDYLKNHSFD